MATITLGIEQFNRSIGSVIASHSSTTEATSGLDHNPTAQVLALLLASAIAVIVAQAVGFGLRLDGTSPIKSAVSGGSAGVVVLGIGFTLITAL
ncbi:hypothetical protein ACWIGI_24205 [Nocardia sp. NPDC055321]